MASAAVSNGMLPTSSTSPVTRLVDVELMPRSLLMRGRGRIGDLRRIIGRLRSADVPGIGGGDPTRPDRPPTPRRDDAAARPRHLADELGRLRAGSADRDR